LKKVETFISSKNINEFTNNLNLIEEENKLNKDLELAIKMSKNV